MPVKISLAPAAAPPAKAVLTGFLKGAVKIDGLLGFISPILVVGASKSAASIFTFVGTSGDLGGPLISKPSSGNNSFDVVFGSIKTSGALKSPASIFGTFGGF